MRESAVHASGSFVHSERTLHGPGRSSDLPGLFCVQVSLWQGINRQETKEGRRAAVTRRPISGREALAPLVWSHDCLRHRKKLGQSCSKWRTFSRQPATAAAIKPIRNIRRFGSRAGFGGPFSTNFLAFSPTPVADTWQIACFAAVAVFRPAWPGPAEFHLTNYPNRPYVTSNRMLSRPSWPLNSLLRGSLSATTAASRFFVTPGFTGTISQLGVRVDSIGMRQGLAARGLRVGMRVDG
jgi:hypothetical protein